jgi:hypothetical protein
VLVKLEKVGEGSKNVAVPKGVVTMGVAILARVEQVKTGRRQEMSLHDRLI